MDLRLYVFLVAGFLLGTSYAQELTVNPSGEQEKRVGDGAGFTCTASQAQPGTHKWINKDGSPVLVIGEDAGASQASPNAQRSGSLLLLSFSQLKDGDEGEYTCQATINGQQQQKSVILKIYRPITVVSAPPNQTPKINTDALVECEVTANPTPTIQWLFASNRSEIQGTRYRQVANGLQILNITKADDGDYLCRALIISKGDMKDIYINVKVTIPPRITVPLSHRNPIAGRPLTMVCQASGDPTPTFMFYKRESGQKTPLDGPKYEMDKIRGELTIKQLTVDDEGTYICDANNVGGSAEAEAEIDVMVPPVITQVQNSTDQKQGDPGALVCVATGDPAPTMTWRRFDMNSPYASSGGDSQGPVVEEVQKDMGQYKEVTLYLRFSALKPSDTQNYTCEATNLAGNASQNGQIILQFKPNFEKQAEMYGTTFFGWGGHSTVIKCVADAHPMPSFQWMHNGAVITANDTYSMNQEMGVRRITSMLSVNVKTGMEFLYGGYICSATNHIGNSNITLTLRRADPPGQPMVIATDIKPTAIELMVSPPNQDGGQPVLEYIIEYTPEGTPEPQTVNVPKNTDPNEPRTKHTIMGLKASTTYTISIAARNNVAKGNPIVFSEKTTDESTPEAVTVISDRQGDLGRSFELKWNKPLTGGRELTRYIIRYRTVSVVNPDASTWEVDSSKPMGDQQEARPTGEALSFTLTGLASMTFYQVEISAVNALGESPRTTLIVRTGSGGYEPVTQEESEGVQVEQEEEGPQDPAVVQPEDTKPQESVVGGATGLTTGAVIGIIILLLIVIFLVIDVAFYFTKNCGALWYLQQKITGKQGRDRERAKVMEEGDKEQTENLLAKDGKPEKQAPEDSGEVGGVEMEPEDKEKAAQEKAEETAEEGKGDAEPAKEAAEEEEDADKKVDDKTPLTDVEAKDGDQPRV